MMQRVNAINQQTIMLLGHRLARLRGWFTQPEDEYLITIYATWTSITCTYTKYNKIQK